MDINRLDSRPKTNNEVAPWVRGMIAQVRLQKMPGRNKLGASISCR